MALRAEAVRVGTAAPAQPGNRSSGRLAGTSFLGGEVQYVVIADDGTETFARMPLRDAPDVRVGDTVWCSWDADAVLVFAGEDAR